MLCLFYIGTNLVVGQYVKKRWKISKRKELLYWPLNRNHALMEAFLMIGFLVGAVAFGNQLMGTINWVYYLFFYFFISSISRAFMEWKHAKNENIWITQLTEAAVAAVLLLSFLF